MSENREGGREQLIQGASPLGIAMSADIATRLVDHPQLGDWLLDLYACGGEGFEVSFVRYKHVLKHPSSPHAYQP